MTLQINQSVSYEISALCSNWHHATSNCKRVCKNSKGNCMCECHMPKDWLVTERR